MVDRENKTVVITGGSSGIGKFTATLFARHYEKIVITYNRSRQAAEDVVQQIEADGGYCKAYAVDFRDESSINVFWDSFVKDHGSLDILINNAGILGGATFQSEMSEWQDTFQIDFFASVICSQRAAEIMSKKRSGKIINTSSIRGLNHAGRGGVMAYSAAKAALNNFTVTLAKELAPYIQVNAIAPGFVNTPYYQTIDKERCDKFVQDSLIKRFVEPTEVAEGFLCLSRNDAVTGQIVVIDGGYTLTND